MTNIKKISKKSRSIYSLTSVAIRRYIQEFENINNKKINAKQYYVNLKQFDGLKITMATLKDMQALLKFDEEHDVKTADEIVMMRNTIKYRIEEMKQDKETIERMVRE